MTTNTPKKRSSTLDELRSRIEALRLKAIDAEALAKSAEERLERMQYIPRTQRGGEDEVNIRLQFGRLQSMVIATARATRALLDDVEELLDLAQQADEPSDCGNGGGNGNGGSGGDPGLSAAYVAGRLHSVLDRAELILQDALRQHHVHAHARWSMSASPGVMAVMES